jgi:hypothetical protein
VPLAPKKTQEVSEGHQPYMSVGSKLGGPGQGEALKSTFIAVLLTNVSKVEISPLHCIALEVMARVM